MAETTVKHLPATRRDSSSRSRSRAFNSAWSGTYFFLLLVAEAVLSSLVGTHIFQVRSGSVSLDLPRGWLWVVGAVLLSVFYGLLCRVRDRVKLGAMTFAAIWQISYLSTEASLVFGDFCRTKGRASIQERISLSLSGLVPTMTPRIFASFWLRRRIASAVSIIIFDLITLSLAVFLLRLVLGLDVGVSNYWAVLLTIFMSFLVWLPVLVLFESERPVQGSDFLFPGLVKTFEQMAAGQWQALALAGGSGLVNSRAAERIRATTKTTSQRKVAWRSALKVLLVTILLQWIIAPWLAPVFGGSERDFALVYGPEFQGLTTFLLVCVTYGAISVFVCYVDKILRTAVVFAALLPSAMPYFRDSMANLWLAATRQAKKLVGSRSTIDLAKPEASTEGSALDFPPPDGPRSRDGSGGLADSRTRREVMASDLLKWQPKGWAGIIVKRRSVRMVLLVLVDFVFLSSVQILIHNTIVQPRFGVVSPSSPTLVFDVLPTVFLLFIFHLPLVLGRYDYFTLMEMKAFPNPVFADFFDDIIDHR